MAQPNSEQYREQTALSSEKGDSFSSAGNGGSTVEQRTAEEQDFDLSGSPNLRESPTSQVGYGGGDDKYYESPDLSKSGYWGKRSDGDNEEESRYGQDRRGSDSSDTVEQRGGTSSYGTVDPNARPSEAGFGSSGPGGYPDEGGYNLGSHGDAPSKSSGTYGGSGQIDDFSGYGSEVRNGVPHRVTSGGVASGVDGADGFGESTPTSSDIEQHRYHQTEVPPSEQKDTPYSQVFTQPDGPREGIRDQFQEEGVTGNTEGGTAVDHRKLSEEAEHPESEGFLAKLRHKLPGHGNKHEVTDSTSDAKEVGSDSLLEGDEIENAGCMPKLKDKLLPNHEKHYDEMDPKLY